jgi:hypothetical protein
MPLGADGGEAQLLHPAGEIGHMGSAIEDGELLFPELKLLFENGDGRLVPAGKNDRAIGPIDTHGHGLDILHLLGQGELHLSLGIGRGDKENKLAGRVAAGPEVDRLYGELNKLAELAHQAIDPEVLAARKAQALAIGSLKAWRQLVK